FRGALKSRPMLRPVSPPDHRESRSRRAKPRSASAIDSMASDPAALARRIRSFRHLPLSQSFAQRNARRKMRFSLNESKAQRTLYLFVTCRVCASLPLRSNRLCAAFPPPSLHRKHQPYLRELALPSSVSLVFFVKVGPNHVHQSRIINRERLSIRSLNIDN